ncbi:MAG: hypothetical protein H8E48_11430 [Chloroflexi bacterium]|nr:hypothetical protein [Chloroflexota bacterium]
MLNQKRQRPIPVTSSDRETLEQYKKAYEEITGTEGGDWGAFLRGALLLGLAAVDVFQLSRVIERQGSSATIRCAKCYTRFLMAIPDGVAGAIQIECPHCKAELVIPLTIQKASERSE